MQVKKNGLSITVGILLILAGLFNIGSSVAQFSKGELLQSSTSALASFGESSSKWKSTSEVLGEGFAKKSQNDAQKLRSEGQSSGLVIKLIGVFIFAVAIVSIASSIGIFSSANWTSTALMICGIGGILVEIQDVVEDGFSIQHAVFIGVYALALFVTYNACKEPTDVTS